MLFFCGALYNSRIKTTFIARVIKLQRKKDEEYGKGDTATGRGIGRQYP